MNVKKTFACALFIACSGATNALFAQGLLTGNSYPEHQCGEKPKVPVRPETFENDEAISAYNSQVEAYNTSVQAYVECVQDYVDSAAKDIELIRAFIANAVDEANE